MTVISGKLLAPNGDGLDNANITFLATANSESVIISTESAITTDENGNYNISLGVGSYQVSLTISGQSIIQLGPIQILSDSPDGTLNDFLLRPAVAPTGYVPYPGFTEVATFAAIPSGATGFYLVDADETKGGTRQLYALTATATQWVASELDS